MRLCMILLVAAALLGGCAKPPHQELDATEYMVNRVRALQAADHAPTEFNAAVTALDDARSAIRDGKYKSAHASLKFALQHARRASVITEERKAKLAEEAARLSREEQLARQAEADKLPAETVIKAEPAKPQPVKPVVARKPEAQLPATSYQVINGENLWNIAAHPQVYNDGLLWPLLYQANRDQIKDPRQIFPGQSLSIRRDMSSEEMESARQKARESDIFPIPPQATGKAPKKQ